MKKLGAHCNTAALPIEPKGRAPAGMRLPTPIKKFSYHRYLGYHTGMDRRSFIYSSTALTLLANAPGPLLVRAIDRAGGLRALKQVRRLHWTGQATIHAPQGRMIEIGVRTQVVPFVSARSDSWLLNDKPAKVNSLIIEPGEAWVVRAGRERQPMPKAMAVHERAQYALYGLMLLATLRDRGASANAGPHRDTLKVRHRGAPDTIFGFNDRAEIAWATNTVPSPDGGANIQQRITFDGEIMSGKVRWPRRIAIEQDGRPYFDLQLEAFATSAV